MRLAACIAAAACMAVQAEITVKEPWVRATVPQQRSTAGYMTLTSSVGGKVVGVSSPAAKIAEIHETRTRDGVSGMHAVDVVELPAGKAVELKPGGLHVMLMALKSPVAQGDKVPIVLTVEERGRRTTVEVRAEARPPGAR